MKQKGRGEWLDQPQLFCHGYEVKRQDDPALGMQPSRQQFEPRQVLLGKADDRLIERLNIFLFDSQGEFARELLLQTLLALEADFIEMKPGSATGFTAVHGAVRTLQQEVGV